VVERAVEYSIGFEGPPEQPPGTDYGIYEYAESGFLFTPLGVPQPGNTFGRVRSGDLRDPDNSGHYLRSMGEGIQFSLNTGSLFGLVSLELAEYSTVASDAATVEFVGYRYDGSIVRQTFTTDGIIDGTGPLADFETFTFGSEFNDLLRVEVPPSFGWSLDNIAVTVPEPGAVSLGALGLVALWWRRRQGSSRTQDLKVAQFYRGEGAALPPDLLAFARSLFRQAPDAIPGRGIGTQLLPGPEPWSLGTKVTSLRWQKPSG
jgi:hypothetical protein